VARWEALGDVDVGKRIKNLKKKVRQIEELENRAKAGEELNQGEKERGPGGRGQAARTGKWVGAGHSDGTEGKPAHPHRCALRV
jgi:hypothetical protein